MDNDDWNRFEELVYQAGGILNDGSQLTQSQLADAMSFHTLGLAILDLKNHMARSDTAPNQLVGSPIIVSDLYGK